MLSPSQRNDSYTLEPRRGFARKFLWPGLILLALTAMNAAPAKANGCPQARPQLIAPANGALDLGSPVSFEWAAVEGAEGYRVSVVEESFDIDVVAQTSSTTASARLAPGTFAWFVEAFFEHCESTVSDIHVFEMARAEDCSEVAPTTLAPTRGAMVTSPVTFSWTAVPGAIAYEVEAVLDEGEPVFVGETTGTSLTAHLGEGHVRWEVEAEFNGCEGTVSAESSFDIPFDPSCDHNAPFPVAPGFGATRIPTRVDFVWTAVEGATGYTVLLVTDNNEDVRVLGSATATRLTASVPAGRVSWAVVAEFAGCPPETSAISIFDTATADGCRQPDAPKIYIAPRAISGEFYTVNWSAGLNVGLYEVQESTFENFSNVTTRPVNDVLLTLSHDVTEPTRFFYRVRSLSNCGAGPGPWSETAATVVSSSVVLLAGEAELAASYGNQRVIVQRVRVPGSATPVSFTARTDQPWLTVSPASGTIPPEGLELTVTARSQDLPIGTNTATILLTYSGSGKRNASGASLPASIPVSVSLVTIVSPDAGNSPLPTSMIIPAVAHARGAGTRFESDVRIVNASAQEMKYLLNFTPSGTDGTKNGHQTTVQISPGDTAALDDVLRNFYGFAAESDNVSGMLEIRPVGTSSTSRPPKTGTFASSRTYAVTADGTLGQFIPAILFSDFIGKRTSTNGPPPVLSFQQIAQSAAYRTNLGIVEGSGESASVQLSVFGDAGQSLGVFPIELKPREHLQLNSFLQSKGLSTENGRIEMSVTSATGRITGYASVVDNRTNDPMLIPPVDLSKDSPDRVTIPGIADLNNSSTNWRSDLRLLNAGPSDTQVTLMFIPEGSSTGVTKMASAQSGRVLQIDNALQSFFGAANQAGSVIVTSPTGSKIVTTARTYNQTSGGTYGQFIPAISAAEGVGVEDRALQILHVEESENFRTNLGIVELTGNPASVEISVVTPGSKVAMKMEVSLAPNEFRQLNRILRQLGLGATYNARVTLKVIGGSGRVSGYASLIDNRTGDPTYVPAQ